MIYNIIFLKDARRNEVPIMLDDIDEVENEETEGGACSLDVQNVCERIEVGNENAQIFYNNAVGANQIDDDSEKERVEEIETTAAANSFIITQETDGTFTPSSDLISISNILFMLINYSNAILTFVDELDTWGLNTSQLSLTEVDPDSVIIENPSPFVVPGPGNIQRNIKKKPALEVGNGLPADSVAPAQSTILNETPASPTQQSLATQSSPSQMLPSLPDPEKADESLSATLNTAEKQLPYEPVAPVPTIILKETLAGPDQQSAAHQVLPSFLPEKADESLSATSNTAEKQLPVESVAPVPTIILKETLAGPAQQSAAPQVLPSLQDAEKATEKLSSPINTQRKRKGRKPCENIPPNKIILVEKSIPIPTPRRSVRKAKAKSNGNETKLNKDICPSKFANW